MLCHSFSYFWSPVSPKVKSHIWIYVHSFYCGLPMKTRIMWYCITWQWSLINITLTFNYSCRIQHKLEQNLSKWVYCIVTLFYTCIYMVYCNLVTLNQGFMLVKYLEHDNIFIGPRLLLHFSLAQVIIMHLCVGREDVGNLDMEWGFIKKCDTLKYLGTIVTNTGTCDRNIQNRISVGNMATKVLLWMLWNKNLCKVIKKNIFHSILLYGGEMWQLT